MLTSPCAGPFVAYEPDAGAGNGFTGIQTVHYENNSTALCSDVTASSTPIPIAFPGSVESVAFDSQLSDGVALMSDGSGNYHLVQAVFNASVGQLTPAGAPYDLSVTPSPAPTVSGAPVVSATPTVVPLITDASSIAINGVGSQAVALTLGPASTGLVALTSLAQAPAQFGNSVQYVGPGYTVKPGAGSRTTVAFSNATDGTVALVRGPSDLLAFAVTVVNAGYQFDVQAVDTTLGSGIALRGMGNVAIDPTTSARALVGGTTAGGGTTLTLVTGLPTKITKSSSISMPGNINSIAIDSTGATAYVATDVGLVVVGGVNTGVLAIKTPFHASSQNATANSFTYTDCNGNAAEMTYISSVRVSSGANYLVVLGRAPGTACAATGFTSSVVAVPFAPAAGTPATPASTPTANAAGSPSPSPYPTKFVENNVITPPSAADYFLVH